MKIRIRFLISTLSGGGAEKVLTDLLGQLDKNIYDISLVTVAGGIHLAAIPARVSARVLVPRCAWLRKLVYKLPPKLFARLFLHGQYDVEVAYLEGLPTRFLAAKKMNSGAKIAFVHCDLSVKNIIEPFYKNKKECLDEYRTFSRVCFVSEVSRDGFYSVIGELENSCVVHNIVDFDRAKVLSQEECGIKFESKSWKLVTVGRLTKVKGYDRLLRVVAELEKAHELELWILGEGEERTELERMIQELDIRSVRLLGYQENPYAFVRKADLFVCSSLSEGYSTAVTEAIALGVPVLTTDCSGMDEILACGKYGTIVENSEDGLRNGLRRILEDKGRFIDLKGAALERSRQLTNEQALGEYTALFSSAAEER